MSTSVTSLIPDRHAAGRVWQARVFSLIVAGAITAAFTITWLLVRLFGVPAGSDDLQFPPAFVFSTALLFAGSGALHSALSHVRHEHQRLFRQRLFLALALGVAFIGVQAYGLRVLFPLSRSPDQASRGVTPLVLMFAGLHALHFSVAILFLAFVVSRTVADRYDHEYHWGVTVCTWFWHALCVAWLAILGIFAVAI